MLFSVEHLARDNQNSQSGRGVLYGFELDSGKRGLSASPSGLRMQEETRFCSRRSSLFFRYSFVPSVGRTNPMREHHTSHPSVALAT